MTFRLICERGDVWLLGELILFNEKTEFDDDDELDKDEGDEELLDNMGFEDVMGVEEKGEG